MVEDNQRYAELIEHMLGDDFAPERAATLGDAVAALQQRGGYSCILLDLLLPGTDRLDAVEAIRGLAPDTPIVVLTGVEHGGLAVEAMKAGVQDYLHKGDMDPETLRRAVIYAMERKTRCSWRTRRCTTRSQGSRTGRFSAIAACRRSPGSAGARPG